MLTTALSASRIKKAESCSWSYWATYKLKVPDRGNDGASRGWICHLIFELLGDQTTRQQRIDEFFTEFDNLTQPPPVFTDEDGDGLLDFANSYDGENNITDDNPFGINLDDPFGNDDVMIQSDVINLENNRPVKILLRSVDVLHNWYVPQFRAKMDAVPGIVTFYWFEPNKTGEFEVLCAEYCGVGHYAMRGGVEVQDKQDYDNWLQEQETFSDLIAKQKILENEKTKLAKK